MLTRADLLISLGIGLFVFVSLLALMLAFGVAAPPW